MAWYEEAVFYHMYPLGMVGAPYENKEEDVVHRIEDLKLWIPHLIDLNFNAIYIGPLFESTTHGYDTKDYRLVDRRLGDNADFKEFVQLCHQEGIRVVVDGVFNHTGREFFAFKDLKEKREGSRYKDWYKGVNFWGNTRYNDGFGYEAWRNCFELVNLNLRNPEVKNYLLETIDFWIDEFDIDGIRLDCADCLDFDFMKEMRWRTGQKKAEFWLMGEVIHGDYSRWVNDEMLHSVTDYELHKGLYSGHNDQNYFEIAHTVRRLFDANGGLCKGRRLYSFVDNHDVERIASKLKNKEHLYPVLLLLYTLPGIPSIYYGSEWGIEGKKENGRDEPLRPYIDPKSIEEKKNEISDWVKSLGKLYQENKEIPYGRYQELMLKNRQYAFAKRLDHSAVVVAVNNDTTQEEICIPGFMNVGKAVDLITEKEIPVEGNGMIRVLVPGNKGRVIKVVSPDE